MWSTLNLIIQKPQETKIVNNKIYPPIIEKQKIIDSCERSVHQLLQQYSATEKRKSTNI